MIEYFWKKNGGKEDIINMNVLFMRICKRIEFGMNLDNIVIMVFTVYNQKLMDLLDDNNVWTDLSTSILKNMNDF